MQNKRPAMPEQANRPGNTSGGSGTETIVYLHTDHLGTPRLATDANGVKVWSWEGRAFGDAPPNEDPDGDGKKTVIDLRFTGQVANGETGLIYNGANYYDPKTGRWITPDGMSVAQHVLRWQVMLGRAGMPPLEINPYARTVNNPLRWIDPDGFETVAVGPMSPVPQAPTQPVRPITIPPWLALPAPATAAILGGIGALLYPPALCENEEDCLKEWRDAHERCRQLIYEQMQQAAGRKKKRSVTGVTGGFTDVEECARGLGGWATMQVKAKVFGRSLRLVQRNRATITHWDKPSS